MQAIEILNYWIPTLGTYDFFFNSITCRALEIIKLIILKLVSVSVTNSFNNIGILEEVSRFFIFIRARIEPSLARYVLSVFLRRHLFLTEVACMFVGFYKVIVRRDYFFLKRNACMRTVIAKTDSSVSSSTFS